MEIARHAIIVGYETANDEMYKMGCALARKLIAQNKNIVQLECIQCGQMFVQRHKLHTKYCSKECCTEAAQIRREAREELKWQSL